MSQTQEEAKKYYQKLMTALLEFIHGGWPVIQPTTFHSVEGLENILDIHVEDQNVGFLKHNPQVEKVYFCLTNLEAMGRANEYIDAKGRAKIKAHVSLSNEAQPRIVFVGFQATQRLRDFIWQAVPQDYTQYRQFEENKILDIWFKDFDTAERFATHLNENYSHDRTRTRFLNKAGNHADTDDILNAELEAAGITTLASMHPDKTSDLYRAMREMSGEVKTSTRGYLHGWQFERGWYYWTAKGPGLNIDIATELHEDFGKEVRVAGHCGCPHPRDWYKGMAVPDYHIDTVEGLKALADAIKQAKEENDRICAERGIVLEYNKDSGS